MDASTLSLIKSKVQTEVSQEHIRDEILKIISVIEESRSPSILNLNEQEEKSSGSARSAIRYDRLSKQELMDLFLKIHNVRRGDTYLTQLEEYIKMLIEKQD
ncbi:uncharacterized protein LOC103509755 [Diaphorina citri]|jgi:hypothetical protein|uniref:Uncharacterized protein LOC103509755 n=1 Tax=Diaphorina citri TaxID=121845 RepID=A0A1S3D1X3_DIACI|nr:uncharacterized protein LOC103509755 [Diaphorina citri]XP_008472605.1 uncharacterized protein LOC103509755 [Diaphorina citri]KAI5707259.1 hypothetical protein M8J75_016117 [Diaphorina citri]KAI5740156.1 hypothetical protein M8J76_001007 [Diaphorina citri]